MKRCVGIILQNAQNVISGSLYIQYNYKNSKYALWERPSDIFRITQPNQSSTIYLDDPFESVITLLL
jgi:hypothetical protein